MTRYFDDFNNFMEVTNMPKQEIEKLNSTWLEELFNTEKELRDITLKLSLDIQAKKQDLRELSLIRRCFK